MYSQKAKKHLLSAPSVEPLQSNKNWFLSWAFVTIPNICSWKALRWVEDVTNNTSWHRISHSGSAAVVVLVSESLHGFLSSPPVPSAQPFTLPHLSPLYSISFSRASFSRLRLYYQNFGSLVAFWHLWFFPTKNNQAGRLLSLRLREWKKRIRKAFSFPSFPLCVFLFFCCMAPQAAGSPWTPGVICGCLAVNLSD